MTIINTNLLLARIRIILVRYYNIIKLMHIISYQFLACNMLLQLRESYLQNIDNIQKADPETVLESQMETDSSLK